MNRSGPGELTLVGVALVAIVAYTAVAGSTNGQESLAAVGLFAVVLFVAGIVWPSVALARVRIDASAPADATAGDLIPLHLRIRGRVARLELRVLDPAGEWRRCTAPGDGDLLHIAARRGVFRYARVEVRSAAPLGVFQRRRVVVAPLDRPIAVGPFPTREAPVLRPLPGGDAPVPLPIVSMTPGDAVRSVRPYVPGDAARLVHWPTSARRGELVVREQEPAVVPGVAVVVDLRGAPVAAEEAASRAAGIANATLAAGGRVVLATVEPDGVVVAAVRDRRAVGRRLAAAVPGVPPLPPDGWPVVEVRAEPGRAGDTEHEVVETVAPVVERRPLL
ncbi:MAG: hypothetical protein QOI55_870 [Actinomycetota bacterium]|nr:hypothetical protein [Actinomycetota bacterium]